MARKKSASPKKPGPKKDLLSIDRAAKRKAQKEQGAFDGRFRPRVVKSKKRYSRRRDKTGPDEVTDH
ncbi:MAG: hypothetical protein IPH53_07585 [Flavobacteriales bacterium]|nr:hypothetical protein [Flavobacteriales bacterium]